MRVAACLSWLPVRTAAALTLVALLLGMAGCTGEPTAKADPSTYVRSTSDESSIDTVRRSASVAVVLFQTPSECLTCSADLYRWIELARETQGAFLIALSENPTAEEAAAMKRMRLKFTVLRSPHRSTSAIVPPAIAVFRGPDTLVFEDHVTAKRRSQLFDNARRALQRM